MTRMRALAHFLSRDPFPVLSIMRRSNHHATDSDECITHQEYKEVEGNGFQNILSMHASC